MGETSPEIIFIDDDENLTSSLIRSLKKTLSEYLFSSAASEIEALAKIQENRPEVAVVDLSLNPAIGPESGLSLITKLLSLDPTIRILVLTGHGTPQYGIEAIQRGAASFLEKPVDISHLESLLVDAVNFSQLRREYLKLSSTPQNIKALTGLSSRTSEMQKVLSEVAFAANTLQPVLLLGETGTGKTMLAQAIHHASARKKAPFIRFQPSYCGQDLIVSELFGHQKGSFTGASQDRRGLIEEANRGTLFIDEIDELPIETQVMLLNTLQENKFRRLGMNQSLHSDFRLIAASNRPLEQVKQKLREDFFHRIAHQRITLPALRNRFEDIPDLSRDFVERLSTKEDMPVCGLTEPALTKLMRYNFPGNIRELQAVVEGATYRANYEGRRFIEATDIILDETTNSSNSSNLDFRSRVQAFELDLVQQALKETNNNQAHAAARLGLDRTVLRRILARQSSKQ